MEGINWNEMEGKFLKIKNGVPTRLKLSRWRQQDKFKYTEGDKNGQLRFGISFDVLEENGAKYEGAEIKEMTITALKACGKFRPIIERAEAAGKPYILVSVLKAGENKQTVYEVNELSERFVDDSTPSSQ